MVQPRDRPYLYMPNPAIIHHQSAHVEHSLAVVDVFIKLGKPHIFQLEPQVSKDYRPDVYTRIDGKPIIIEVQRTRISQKRMDEKVQMFAEAFYRKQHDSRTLMIVSDYEYKVRPHEGVEVIQDSLSVSEPKYQAQLSP